MKFLLLLPRRQSVVPDLRLQPLILLLGTSMKSLTYLFYNNSSGSWRLQLNPHCTQHGLLLAAWAQLSRCPSQLPTTLANLHGALCSFSTTFLCWGAQNLDSKCSLTTTTLSSNVRNLEQMSPTTPIECETRAKWEKPSHSRHVSITVLE